MDILNKLQTIGLSRREAEVYLALLQRKEFTAAELTKITTITRTKIYDILQNLIHKGAVSESYKNGVKIYRGIKPNLALQNIILKYEQEIEEKKKTEIEQKRKAAVMLENELDKLHKNNLNKSEPLDYIETLTDLAQIRERWNDFQRNTKNEILVFTKPPYTASLENNIDVQSELLKSKNIIDKCIYEYEGLNLEEITGLIKVIEKYQQIGEECRIIDKLPMKLAISDETITMLALNDRVSLKPSITTIVVDHPDFAKAQKAVFETYWEKAFTIEEFKKKMGIVN